MFDYHLHSKYSTDSNLLLDDICNTAIKLGIDEIAFTDHIDLDWPEPKGAFNIDNIDQYILEIESMQKKYEGMLVIKKGMEIGLQPHILDEISRIIDSYPVDFIIGSVHLINGMDPYMQKYYEDKTKEQSYIRYYEEILSLIKSFNKFDVLGHLDYVKRYSPYSWQEDDYLIGLNIIDNILIHLIKNGKGIEVNTSGYRHTSHCPMPHFDIINRYKKFGGKIITLGSDAHRLEHIGLGFNETVEKLKNIGFHELTKFANHEPEFIKI